MAALPNDLTTYLNTIKDVKQQIDGVLSYETSDSTPFTEYPTYIASAIQGGGSGDSVDPWYGETLDIVGAINDDTFPVNGDLLYATISSDFVVNLTPNNNVESVTWKESVDDGNNNVYTIKYIVETSHDLAGNDTNTMQDEAVNIEQSLEDYPDLYGNIVPTLTEVTMTKSADPQRDGWDYSIEGNLYAWNLSDNCSLVETITESGFVPNGNYLGYDIQVQGGLVQGVASHVFVSIRPGLTGDSNFPYFSPSEIQDGAEQYVENEQLVAFDDTYDTGVQVHTLISSSFPSWGIDPDDFVSSIRQFSAFKWNSEDPTDPIALNDLTCTTMLQEGNSDTDCWCLVEGTLQVDTDVCFKSDSCSWDSGNNQWDPYGNETLIECMPVVEKYEDEYSTYGWSTSTTLDGIYISLPAGPVRLYLHYMEGDGASTVYYNAYDDLNSQWSAKWYDMSETGAMTFVSPIANE